MSEDTSYWYHQKDLAENAGKALSDMTATLGNEAHLEVTPTLNRATWEDGSFYEVALVPFAEGELAWRVAHRVRTGPVTQAVYALSPFTRVAPSDSVSLAEVSLEGVFPDHPFGGPQGRPLTPADEAFAKLSAKAQEVLTDLDGERKRARKAGKGGYAACVVCHQAIVIGQLYEFQKESSSKNRRVHVECLRDLGLNAG